MTPDLLLFFYVVSLLAALCALAIYSARRQRWFGPRPSDDHVFRCGKCGYVYTDDPDVDRSRCQQCGTLNEAFKF
jgi:rubrerythrin